jgi:hypothetical protein
MRNIIGQTKSGFNLRDIMDNKKILLVNLSKGKMGELNSKLLGIIFVMKFQAAAMGRANLPEDQRVDFSLYVDEFQNFATESFESILSEARKYRLNLILGNQFMTQLTDKIREAIIGNVGTVISGRIGITDAEILVKKFAPTFDAEDLTKMPNYQSVTSVMINNVPSAPFSMSFVPPMGQTNSQLSDALKRLSAAKYGKPRTVVEKDIFTRLGAADAEKKAKAEALKKAQQQRMTGLNAPRPVSAGGGSSFLDEWLSKRQQMNNNGTAKASVSMSQPVSPAPLNPSSMTSPTPSIRPEEPLGGARPASTHTPAPQAIPTPYVSPQRPVTTVEPHSTSTTPAGLHLRPREGTATDDEITFKIR